MYASTLNQIFKIDELEFKYLDQKDKFIYNEEIEKKILQNLSIKNAPSHLKNLFINVSVNKIDTESLIVKSVLDNYNYYHKLYLIVETNHSSISLLEKILSWFNGFERLTIVCQFPQKEDLYSNPIKNEVLRLQKQYDLKFILEPYYTIYNTDNYGKSKPKKIKISPLISSKEPDITEAKKLISIIRNDISNINFNKSIQLGLKSRPSSIISITDNDLINTNNTLNKSCNSCWAKSACFANHSYKMFSTHPYICSINTQNCFFIKKTILDTLKQNLALQEKFVNDKLENKILKYKEHKIYSLN
ncbi:hypothetical protein [Tenacibaculum amylolyticum]|uniref:hypothetical protein n=1 Tax=Tenacibaculum amylolyticum TaxID=104269 RepID=UPI0038B519AA